MDDGLAPLGWAIAGKVPDALNRDLADLRESMEKTTCLTPADGGPAGAIAHRVFLRGGRTDESWIATFIVSSMPADMSM
jgi:hypothetical protein